MQGPCQHHSSSLLGRGRRNHGYLSIALVLQLEHMHIRSLRLDRTCEANDVQLCILALKQDLCLCSCPPRVCRQHNACKGHQELGNCQELLMHALGAPSVPSGPGSPGSGNLSKKTTAIFRPEASPSWLLCSWPGRVLISVAYREADGVAGDLVH